MVITGDFYGIIYIYIIMYIIYIWLNYNDLTVLPHWESWFRIREIIPFYGRKISG